MVHLASMSSPRRWKTWVEGWNDLEAMISWGSGSIAHWLPSWRSVPPGEWPCNSQWTKVQEAASPGRSLPPPEAKVTESGSQDCPREGGWSWCNWRARGRSAWHADFTWLQKYIDKTQLSLGFEVPLIFSDRSGLPQCRDVGDTQGRAHNVDTTTQACDLFLSMSGRMDGMCDCH